MLLCFLRCVHGPPMQLRVGLLQPSANARQLLELLELHLESVRLRSEVDRVELRVAVVGRLGERQGELFADRWPTDPHQLAVLVNRLSSRLGFDCVLRAEPRASPVPERGVQWKTALETKVGAAKRCRDRETRRPGDKESGRSSRAPSLPLSLSPCLPPRPLLLYPEPLKVEVMCVSPDGPPQCLWLEGHRESIASCVGPERIETLWWRGPTVRRDYYRITIESGIQLWLFRPLSERGWFVHGVFA